MTDPTTSPDIHVSFPQAALVPQGRFAQLPRISIGRSVTIVGSSEGTHLRLRSRTVSAAHAVILNCDGRVIICDLASETHLFVNGRRTRLATLGADDEIRIGKIGFRLDPGTPDQALDPAAAPGGFLRVRDGDGDGTAITAPVCLIGSSPQADVRLSGESVQAVHAMIISAGGHYYLRDLVRSDTTRLDGQPVRQARVGDGSLIDIAGMQLHLELADPADDPPAVLDEPADPPQANAVRVDHGPARRKPDAPLAPPPRAAMDAETQIPQAISYSGSAQADDGPAAPEDAFDVDHEEPGSRTVGEVNEACRPVLLPPESNLTDAIQPIHRGLGGGIDSKLPNPNLDAIPADERIASERSETDTMMTKEQLFALGPLAVALVMHEDSMRGSDLKPPPEEPAGSPRSWRRMVGVAVLATTLAGIAWLVLGTSP